MKIEINNQFKQALFLLEEKGKNLILTGRAGTGKSTFLDYFYENTQKQFVLLAPTGVAAVNIGGQTIHSFFRFKPGVVIEEAEKLGEKAKKSSFYKGIDLLIIDEISMVRADLLDCIDIFLKRARKSTLPFGGVQILFIGDLYQLPPVVKGEEKKVLEKIYATPYFFSAKVMEELSAEFIEFEKIYRQRDEEFINLLNSIRNKSIDETMINYLNSRVGIKAEDESFYIYLTPRNQQADEINQKNLDCLSGQTRIFQADIKGDFSEDYFPADVELKLKVGARVMFLNNDTNDRWINGSLGWVKKISDDFVKVKLDEGEMVEVEPFTWVINESYFDEKERKIKRREIGSFTQIPLSLAWAITIHKSQGKTFDKVILDIGKGIFSHGQVYVALSRCRSFTGLILKQPIKKGHIWLDRRVIKFLTNFQYQKAEEVISFEEKLALVKEAIKKKKRLQILYLKAKDEKSRRQILPKKVYQTEFNGYPYTAIDAYCFLRKEVRVFNLKRILKITVVED